MSKAAKKAAPAKRASKRAASKPKAEQEPVEERETLAAVSEPFPADDSVAAERARGEVVTALREKVRESDWTDHEVEDTVLRVTDGEEKGAQVFEAEATRRRRAEGQVGRARE